MKTIEERARIAGQVYQFCKERIEADHKVYEKGYIQGATEQKAIDDEELAEVKRQRDDYYDELLKLRRQKVEIIEWLQEEASRCKEYAKTGYDAYEIGTFEGQYEQAEETIEKIKVMGE